MAEDNLLGAKSSLDALKDVWGRRVLLRRTHGTPGLTKAYICANLLEDAFGMDGMRAFARDLVHGRAGEHGWDTEQLIRAIEAASEKAFVIPNANKEA